MRRTFPFAIRYSQFMLLVLAFLLSGCSFSLAEDITPPPGSEQQPPESPQPEPVSGPLYPLVPPNPQAGGSIYAEKCAPCHGDTGLGDGPQAAQLPNPVAAIGSPELARLSSPARWYTQVTQGNLERFMPPFGSLSDRQRWDVVAYAFSLTAPEAVVAQGAELYQANCAGCHGATGKGDGPEAAALPNPALDFTDQSVMAQKSAADFYQATTEGIPPAMPAYGDQLSEDERWALAAYLRAFTFAASGEQVASGDTPAPQVTAETPEETAASAARSGSITGVVTSAAGSTLPAGLEITLHAFDNMQQVMTQTTTLQPDGSYLFSNVEIPPGRVFMTVVEYQQASYGSDIGMAEEGATTIDLPITVYETTTDTSILQADRLHLFFEFLDAKTLRVIELYIISNPTDQSLVAESPGGPVAQFTLPEGAANLEFQDGALGERFLQTPGGFGDTAAIRPGSGTYEVLFSYTMPYDRKLDLERVMTMPVNAVVILVPEGEIKIKSEGLQDGGTRDVQGTQYHTYSGGNLSGGETLLLTLTGRPTSGTPTLASGSSSSLLVGLGAFGLALIVAGAWLYRRVRTAEPEIEGEEDLVDDAMADSPDGLMDAIIALDDLYQAGQLPDEAYQQRRAHLKARLSELLGDQG